MKKYLATIIGKKITKKGGAMYYLSFFDDSIDGNGCCSLYDADTSYDIGNEVTIIEANFRYAIIESL